MKESECEKVKEKRQLKKWSEGSGVVKRLLLGMHVRKFKGI